MFTDTGEIDHVVRALRDYAGLAALQLTADEEKQHIPGSSPLPALASSLCTALEKSGIERRDLDAVKALRHLVASADSLQLNALQKAYLAALWTVCANQHPADWTDALINQFHRELLAVHAITGDPLRVFDRKDGGRRKGSYGKPQTLVNDIVKAHPRYPAKQVWQALLSTPGATEQDNVADIPGVGKIAFKSISTMHTRAHKALASPVLKINIRKLQ